MFIRIFCILLLGFVLCVNGAEGYFLHPKPDVFILGGDMGQSGQNYSELIETLEHAHRGDKIYIIVEDNKGGWDADGKAIRAAIRGSRAIVTTESRGESSSAALHVLFSGDYVIIPKDDYVHVAHLKFIGSMENPFRGWYNIPEEIQRMSFYKRFLNPKEWQIFVDGGNAWLTGAGICRTAPKKIKDDASHCVIDNRAN